MIRLLVISLGMVALLVGSMMLSGGAARKPAEFPFVNRGDVYTLDINNMSQLQDFRIMYAIREGLYANAPVTYETIPAGALGYDLSPDKKTWTFHLRPQCRWTNGDPVTADDYVFSWRRMLEQPGDYTYLFYYLQNAREYENSYARGDPIDFKTVGMEAVDPLTLRIRLVSPVPFLLDLAAFPPFYPRNERSMAKFRNFSESSDNHDDVMDIFGQYLDAAQKVDGNGSPSEVADRFSKLVRSSHPLDAAAVQNWLHLAKGFEITTRNQAELLDALAVFAAMNPLQGMPPTKNATMINTDAESGDDVLSPLPPAEKLRRMLAKRFVRYTYNKHYTLPPDVVTNGPFFLNLWEFKRRLVKSDNYWDREHVKVNSIEMVVVENKSSQMLAYQSGAVIWDSDVDDEEGDQLRKSNVDYRNDLHSSPAFGTYFISLMCQPMLPNSVGQGKNPLADVRVRQALAMAIDKQEIITKVENMGELPARTYFPPDGTLPKFLFVPGPYDADQSKRYTFEQVQQMLKSSLGGPGPGLPYDVKRARELLAEAGYPSGQGFPALPLMLKTTSEESRYICQILKYQWKSALGIDIDLRPQEAKIYRDSMDKKDFCMGPSSWYGDYPDVSTFTDKYLSTSLNNESGWKNAQFDKYCDQARYELDPAKRLEILAQAENLIDTEVPVIPIYHYVAWSRIRAGSTCPRISGSMRSTVHDPRAFFPHPAIPADPGGDLRHHLPARLGRAG
jgi:oligopeptide transport system substrate-binding protein